MWEHNYGLKSIKGDNSREIISSVGQLLFDSRVLVLVGFYRPLTLSVKKC